MDSRVNDLVIVEKPHRAPHPSPWRIELLGRLHAIHGDRVVGHFPTRQSALLLAFLAYYPGPHRREALIDLLWPEAAPDAGRHRLNVALSSLRRQFQENSVGSGSPIWANRTTVQLDPDAVISDVAAFQAARRTAQSADPPARAAELQRAVELYRGELLPGYCEEWVLRGRGWLAEEYFRALHDWLEILAQTGQWESALEAARRGVRLDPLREEAHAALIRLLAAAGQPGAARRQYRELERLLKEDLGATPSTALSAFVEELEQNGRRPPLVLGPAAQRRWSPTLPLSLTRFIGREREIDQVSRLLQRTRLLTLTGAGGCGKSRLALEIARSFETGLAQGAVLVELASLADPQHLPQAVAAALELRETPGRPLVETLIEFLETRTLLLVLDNCEHLLDACAHLTHTLLTRCPGLRLLATSREPLGIDGETSYPVPSLSVPAAGDTMETEALMEYEAVRLFVERAEAALPSFVLNETNAEAVGEICRRLDGMPLSIELAAARAGVLPVAEIAARLEDRFRLLVGGSRTALPRQQTLAASIDWSHALLSEGEQALLRRVSVFAGGWTLAAAEGICSGKRIEQREVLDRLTSLVRKSLVLYQEPDSGLPGRSGEARYRLLETVRQYAQERLVQSGEAEDLGRRHRDWFLQQAQHDTPLFQPPAARSLIDWMQREHDNLRAALEWCIIHGEREAAARLASAASWFWYLHGYVSEARAWLARLLSQTGETSTTRRTLLALAGWFALSSPDYSTARRLLEEALALYREQGDFHTAASILNHLGWAGLQQGDTTAARCLHAESLAFYRRTRDVASVAGTLAYLGNVALAEERYAEARAHYEESLALARAARDERRFRSGHMHLGDVAWCEGDRTAARSFYEACLQQTCEAENPHFTAECLCLLAMVLCEEGEVQRARAMLKKSLALRREAEDQRAVLEIVEGFAHVAVCEGRAVRAVCLWAAADTQRDALGHRIHARRRVCRARWWPCAQERLGETAFTAAWAAGRAMTLEQAIQFAMHGDDEDEPIRTEPSARPGPSG